jgi:hypothetical protein
MLSHNIAVYGDTRGAQYQTRMGRLRPLRKANGNWPGQRKAVRIVMS